MKLITEQIESIEVLTEEKNGKKSLYISGPFLQAEVTNRNGRCYPFPILEREVKKYTDKFISQGRALGELGHPEGPSVNLDRASHMITSLKAEGNNFMGKAKILDTPMGNIAKSLLDEGVKLGVSSRGVGSLVERKVLSMLAMTSCFQLLLISLPILPRLMHLFKVLWKVKSGFGIMEFLQKKLCNKLIH